MVRGNEEEDGRRLSECKIDYYGAPSKKPKTDAHVVSCGIDSAKMGSPMTLGGSSYLLIVT